MNRIFKLSLLLFLSIMTITCEDDEIFQEVMDVVFEGNLSFNSQDDLTTFETNGYTRIVGDITILDDVVSLVPLTTLVEVEGDVLIRNTSLITLNGLENLITVTGSITINSDLEQGMPIQNINDFCALQNLFTNGAFGTVTIADNGFNPTVQDIIDGNCMQ